MQTVKVLYKFVDGAHFFVSDDEASLGLCVAHTDAHQAFDAVSVQLKKLFKLNHNIDANFQPTFTTAGFVDWLKERGAQSLSGPMPGLAGQFPWSKELLQEAA